MNEISKITYLNGDKLSTQNTASQMNESITKNLIETEGSFMY